MALEWTHRPADRSPRKLIAIAVVAALAVTVGNITYGLWIGLLGFAIVVGSTAEFWLGVHCKIEESGVSSRIGLSASQMAWDQVRRVTVNPDSIKLSPLAEETRLAQFRGVLLRFWPEERDSILDAIRPYCKENVRFHGEGALGGGSGDGD